MKIFTVHPEQMGKQLISLEGGQGYVSISPEIMGYEINERAFGSIRPMFSADYDQLGIEGKNDEVAYVGAEHPKLPDITVLPNWVARGRAMVLGCTLGHYQESPDGCPEYLELYEVAEGVGAMVFDKQTEDSIQMIIGRRGDRFLVPDQVQHTIYNLSDIPLITLDIANPQKHCSDKRLQKEVGPILCLFYSEPWFIGKLNERYVNRKDGFGVKLPQPTASLEIRIPIGWSKDIGEAFYNSLLSSEMVEQFMNLGIRISAAADVNLSDILGIPYSEFAKPLSEIAICRKGLVYDYFYE